MGLYENRSPEALEERSRDSNSFCYYWMGYVDVTMIPRLYFPTKGIWLIWFRRPVIAIDWIQGLTIRFMLRTEVNR